MDISQKGLDLIKRFEGLKEVLPDGRIKSYKCPAGVWTIGYGSTIYPNGQKVAPNDIISMQRAEDVFHWHVSLFVRDVNTLLAGKQLNQDQFDALASFAYNVGSDIDVDAIPEGLGDSSLMKKVLANPNDPTIANEFSKWCKAWVTLKDGTRSLISLPGLVTRRAAESKLYFSK
jgi:lysozyme